MKTTVFSKLPGTGFILDHPRLILLAILLPTILFSLLLPRIYMDNSLEAFTSKHDPDRLFLNRFNKQFGTDDTIIVAFNRKDMFTYESLSLIKRITHKIEELEHIRKVKSLTNVNNIVGNSEDFIVKPLINNLDTSKENLNEIKREALSNPLYLRNLISQDGSTTAILIQLEDLSNNNKEKNNLISIIKKTLAEEQLDQETKFYVAGSGVFNYFSSLYIQGDLYLFLPLILIIVTLVLYIIFRNIRYIFVILSNISICLIWTLGILIITRSGLNTVTIILFPLMIALATILSTYILMHYQCNVVLENNGEATLVDAMHHLFKPCLVASLTTSAGLASLAVSGVPPIKAFGIIAAVAVICSLLLSFTFLPVMLFYIDRRAAKPIKATKFNLFDWLLPLIFTTNVKYPVSIVIICVLLSLFFTAGIFQLKVETNLLEYFRKTSDIYQSTAFIEKNLSGVTFVDISLESKISDTFTDPKVLGQIELLEHYLKSYAQVDKVTSINTYLKEMNKAFHNEDDAYYQLPESQNVISQYFLLFDHEELKNFIDSDYRWTRVSARVTEHSSNKLRELIRGIESYAIKNFGKNVAVQVTGNAVLESNLIEQIVTSQAGSLALAALTVFTLVFLMLRSVKFGIISIVPNVLPQLINFGLMGWVGIPLNTATAMISAIATGIVVDDTIHFLSTFCEEEQRCRDYRQAIRCTLFAKGSAVITASGVLFFGFGVLALSHFVPTSYFGILSAGTMGAALLGELFLLPTLLLLFEPILRRQPSVSLAVHS